MIFTSTFNTFNDCLLSPPSLTKSTPPLWSNPGSATALGALVESSRLVGPPLDPLVTADLHKYRHAKQAIT